MSSKRSAIPRHALVALLVRAEKAAAEGDLAQAKSLLSDLHWFAHSDGQLHRAVHRLELDLARQRGDRRAALGQLVPIAFAAPTSFLESLGPSHEVVQEIAADPAFVYRAIADAPSYAEWNPWVFGAAGETARPGDELVVDVKIGKQKMRVGHRILVATAPERFGWLDLGLFTLVACGRRLRWIERSETGSRLISQIRLYGPLAQLAWFLHGESIRNGMAAEAAALAKRAPDLARASPSGVAFASAPVASGRSASEAKPLAGKTCVITGPTRGIGRPTALALGELGARVILLSRTQETGDAIARELATRGAEGVVVPVDLASLRSTEAAAARVRELAPRIDVLINNAGILNHARRMTEDGLEEGFAVNFLSHFLLTRRLLPGLKAAPAARIVHVTSNTHPIVGKFDFTDYDWQRRPFLGIPAYAHTKLAILLHNRALARRLAGTSVISNAVHPGIIATGMGTDHPWVAPVLNPLVRPIFLTPDEGALPSVYLATSPAVAAHNGAYFVGTRLARPSRSAQDDVAAERLFGLASSLLAERGFAAVGEAA